jgi:hypothetical protein
MLEKAKGPRADTGSSACLFLGDRCAARSRARASPFHASVENGTRRAAIFAARRAREPASLGPLVAFVVPMSSRFDLEATAGRARLFATAGGFRFGELRAARVTLARSPGVLAPPVAVYVAGDGRALAWFGQERPCVLHPTLAELCRMHGVETQSSLAA